MCTPLVNRTGLQGALLCRDYKAIHTAFTYNSAGSAAKRADLEGIAVISEAEAEEYLEASLDLDKREREWRKQFAEEYKKFL